MEEHHAPDWVVVGRAWEESDTDLFTFSALAAPGRKAGDLRQVVADFEWDVRLDFGHPSFYARGGRRRVFFSQGDKATSDGVVFKPFILYRSWHGYVPRTFELMQNFVLYHEAFYSQAESAYKRIDDDGVIHTVARIIRSGDNIRVDVDRHHLRDYLAAHRSYLVRFHDHRRQSRVDIDELLTDKFQSDTLRGDDYCFSLWLRTDMPFRDQKSSSRLFGKDVVAPYAKPDDRHTSWAFEYPERKYANFVIGREQDGRLIESTCDEGQLSNYYRDWGTPHALTPVFFRREVLVKYYNEPSKYRIDSSYVGCLDLWGMPIDVTDEELVQVWLCDLGRLPYSEQLHWREFNVEPRGTISRHRFRRDFLAQWADPEDDPVHDLRRAYENLRKVSLADEGAYLLLPLNEEDAHAYQTLRLPLTEEWREFDEIMQALAKVLVDSLNVGLLEKLTGLSIDGKKVRGSIDLLDHHLRNRRVEKAYRDQAIQSLRSLQTLRSTGVAHRKGEEFNRALSRLGLSGLTKRRAVAKLMTGLTRALQIISQSFEDANGGVGDDSD